MRLPVVPSLAAILVGVAVTGCSSHRATPSHSVSSASAGVATPATRATTTTATPRPLTRAQVVTLAEHDLGLLVKVDYRHMRQDFAAAEAAMTPEFGAASAAGYTTGAPDPSGHLRKESDIVSYRIVEVVSSITAVQPNTSDPSYPTAAVQFVVAHSDRVNGVVRYRASVRLTFANVADRWLVANEEIFPVSA